MAMLTMMIAAAMAASMRSARFDFILVYLPKELPIAHVPDATCDCQYFHSKAASIQVLRGHLRTGGIRGRPYPKEKGRDHCFDKAIAFRNFGLSR
jgi:hypothetical protein